MAETGAEGVARPDPGTDPHELLRRRRVELKRCLALLVLAIARANVWYARREAELAALDRLATATVDRLRNEHRIDASMAWSPTTVAGAVRPQSPRIRSGTSNG